MNHWDSLSEAFAMQERLSQLMPASAPEEQVMSGLLSPCGVAGSRAQTRKEERELERREGRSHKTPEDMEPSVCPCLAQRCFIFVWS